MNELKLNAYAKINLGLDVLRRREDGYHEVRMIMQNIGLCDRVTLKKTGDKGIVIRTNAGELPVNKDNLMYKAADMLFTEFDLPGGILLELEKNIPIAAGLAGGSTDAAAVLHGVNRLYELGLPLEELQKRGVRIGADVPYCLMQGTALAEGIGEKLTRLPACPQCAVVIAKPPVDVSTRTVYTGLRAAELKEHPDIDGMIEALDKADLKGIADRLANVLETVTIPMHPVIADIKNVLEENGAMKALMSGSGPTVFALFDDEEKAECAAEVLKNAGICKTVLRTGMKL